MRLTFLMTALLVLTSLAPALAQAPAPATRGALPDNTIKTLPEPTSAEIREANEVGKICSGSNERDYFDCDCVALNYLQQRISANALGKTSDTFTMKDNAKKACPNSVAVAGRGYRSCMKWAPRMRQDYESFCECYGNAYANAFASKPAISIAENKAVMGKAMAECDVGAPVTARINRNARLREMEQTGTYDEMFPGGSNRTLPTNRETPEPLPSQQAPWQRMQRQLLDTSTPRDTSRQ